MLIPYGWGDKLKKDVPMGIMICDGCRSFSMYFLGRVVFRVHICYIPIFFKTKGYYIFCGNCSNGRQISKEQYKAMKPVYKTFKNKKQLTECYNKAKELSKGLEATDQNVESVFKTLAQSYPIDNEMMANQYRGMIADIMRNTTPVVG